MEFRKLIDERRSVRSYRDVEVPEEDIYAIIEEAERAPSWKNSQTSKFYVARTKEAIAKLTDTLPSFNQSSSAGAALIVTTFIKDTAGFTAGVADNELSNKWGAYDCGLASAYLVLSAKDHGYDTLIMGMRDAAAIREVFTIPKTEQIVSVIALGKAEGETPIRPRKAVDEVLKIF